MVRKIRVYYEGDDQLRISFGQLFVRLDFKLQGIVMPVAGDPEPIKKFRRSLTHNPESVNLLLLDSDEDPNRRQQVSDILRSECSL